MRFLKALVSQSIFLQSKSTAIMSKIKSNILVPKQNTAFSRVLNENPQLLNQYVDELVSVSGGFKTDKATTEIAVGLIKKQTCTEATILLKTYFIGIN